MQTSRFAQTSIIIALLGVGGVGTALAASETTMLEHTGSVTRDDLQGVVSVTISADGNYLYAAAFHVNTITVFRRDIETGALAHVQTLRRDEDLDGVTSIALSADGRYAATAAFRSSTVALFERDADSGQLKHLHTLRNGEDEVTGLGFAIRVKFAPDGKHLYALDGEDGGVTVLTITPDGRLSWVQTTGSQDDVLAGSRGLCLFPDGRALVTANYHGNSIAVLNRDKTTGTVTIGQAIRDGEGAERLEGAFGAVATSDGKFIYVCAGRFAGDQAVSAFRFNAQGELTLIGEAVAGEDRLEPFQGANEIVVSPDDRSVYVTATESGSLACFERNTETGELRLMEVLKNDSGQGVLAGAAGIACSPDGRFVYVAAEFEKTLSIYRRVGSPSVSDGRKAVETSTLIPKAIEYTTFNGERIKLHAWPGEKIVFLTRSIAVDREVMKGLIETFDGVWSFYREATGREPELAKMHDGRLTIAEVDNIDAAAWGYLGATGIELTSAVFADLLNAFAKNGEIDQALPYEFGRNFWFYSPQLAFQKPDEDRPVTTGYAVFMRMMALDAVGRRVGPFHGRPGREFREVMEALVDRYESNSELNWENTILQDKAPENELGLNGTDLFASFCMRLAKERGGLDYVRRLWREVEKRPNAKTTQDAVDNFILAASSAAGQDLTEWFSRRWRWPVSDRARHEAARLPKSP